MMKVNLVILCVLSLFVVGCGSGDGVKKGEGVEDLVKDAQATEGTKTTPETELPKTDGETEAAEPYKGKQSGR